MKLDLSQWRLRKDVDRVYVLHGLHFFFLFLSLIVANIQSGSWFALFLLCPFFVAIYHLFYQTLKKLYYTYWSFAIFLFIFFFFSLFLAELSPIAFYLRAIGLSLLGFQMWTLHDPIYYPIVSWWEYDFRYRDDVRVKVSTSEQKELDGRLTDIRRQAGCLSLFESLRVGDELELTSIDGLSFRKFIVRIMSKRETSFGRPLNYGVKFVLGDSQERLDFDKFCDFWKNERKDKIRQKFQN